MIINGKYCCLMLCWEWIFLMSYIVNFINSDSLVVCMSPTRQQIQFDDIANIISAFAIKISKVYQHVFKVRKFSATLVWRHNRCEGVSNHQLHDCLLNHSFGRRSKKTSKLCVSGFCAGNSPVTGEFPAQMVSNAEKASIEWRHEKGLR